MTIIKDLLCSLLAVMGLGIMGFILILLWFKSKWLD
jgi:hypothetical protein